MIIGPTGLLARSYLRVFGTGSAFLSLDEHRVTVPEGMIGRRYPWQLLRIAVWDARGAARC